MGRWHSEMKHYNKSDKYGWWIDASPKTTTVKSRRPRYGFPVKYCIVCEQAWETERFGDGHYKIRVIHYEEFPRNGLKRKVCFNCKEKYKIKKRIK